MKFWLTIGRFQPLHKGHIALIRTKLDEWQEKIIANDDSVGSDTLSDYMKTAKYLN